MKLRHLTIIFSFLFSLGNVEKVFSETTSQGDELTKSKSVEPTLQQFDDWFLRCSGENVCTLVQVLLMGEGDQAKRLLETAIISGVDGLEIVQMTLPFGIDLRAGIAFRVDEHEEMQAGFVTCLEQGCIVRLRLTEQLKLDLKKGIRGLVGFRPIGASENTVIEISLKGISAGMEALAGAQKS